MKMKVRRKPGFLLRNGQETKYGVREEDCKPGI